MRTQLLAFSIFLFFLPLFSAAQDDHAFEIAFKKMEKQYTQGKYYEANRKASKLLRKINKKNELPQYKTALTSLLIKYQTALGLRLGNIELLQNLHSELDSVDTNTSDSCLYFTHLCLATAANATGNLKISLHHMELARRVKQKPNNTYWNLYAGQLQIAVLAKSMRYQEATEIISSLSADSSFYIRDLNQSKKEIKHIQNQLQLLNIYEAEMALQSGDLQLADSLFTKNFMLNLGHKKDYNYARNSIGATNTQMEQGEREAAYKIKNIRIKYANNMQHSIPNLFYLNLFKADIYSAIEFENYSKFDKLITQFERETSKNFSKKSTHQFTSSYLKYQDRYAKGKYRSYEKQITKIAEKQPQYFDHMDAEKIDFLMRLAEAQIGIFNFTLAENTYQQILRITHANHDSLSPLVNKVNLDLGSLWINYTHNYAAADSVFNKFYHPFVSAQLHPSHKLNMKYLANYALLNEKLDKYDSATYYWEMLTHNTQNKFGKQSTAYAKSLAGLAKTQLQQGKYYKAEVNLFEAKEILTNLKLTKDYQYILTLQAIGELMAINGNIEQSEKMLNEAFELAKKYDNINPFLKISAHQSLAEYYMEIGNYDLAQKITENNIKITQSKLGHHDESLIEVYLLLAQIHLTTGNLTLAEKLADSSLTISNEIFGNQSVSYLKGQAFLASIFFQMGDYEHANKMYSSAVATYRSKNNTQDIMLAELLIGEVKTQTQLNYPSQELIDKLVVAGDIVIENTSDQHPKLAEIMELKALVYARDKNYSEAQIQLQAANFIYVATYGNKHYKTADNQVNLGNLYFEEKKFEKAHKFYGQALNIYEKIFNKSHPKYGRTLGKIGTTYYAQKNYSKSYEYLLQSTQMFLSQINRFFPALTEQQKSKYWNSVKSDFEIFKSLAIHYHKENPTILSHVYNNQLATKALMLNSSVKMKQRIYNLGSEELKAKYTHWQTLNHQYIKLVAQPNKITDSLSTEINKLKYEINRLEKELSESAQGFAENNDHKNVTWSMIKSNLLENESAIEIIRFEYFDQSYTDSIVYLGLVVNKKTKNHPTLVGFNYGNQLEERYIKYYNNSMIQKKEDLMSYKVYWKPFERAIKGSSHIYFSSDGVFNQLNPETFSETKGEYLIDKYQFHFLSNTKDLAKKQKTERATPNYGVLVGNPRFGKVSDTITHEITEIQPLLGAEKEVNEVADLLTDKNWKVTLLTQEKATEEAIRNLNSPKVLHIATHGFFLPEPPANLAKSISNQQFSAYAQPLLRSGLMLSNSAALFTTNNPYQFNSSDGILTAYEVMNLALDETQLVFLSACETGKGKIISGEGVYGLQRAFIIAGAENVIMTLFKVDDKITQELVQQFYLYWLSGKNKREALNLAKKDIAKKHQHPIYWGAFKLTGSN